MGLRDIFGNKVILDGKTINVSGSNIIIQDGKVIVDGKLHSEIGSGYKVVVNGDVQRLRADCSVRVEGDCCNVECSGSCTIEGNVEGDVYCGGSCSCDGRIGGNITAGGNVSM